MKLGMEDQNRIIKGIVTNKFLRNTYTGQLYRSDYKILDYLLYIANQNESGNVGVE